MVAAHVHVCGVCVYLLSGLYVAQSDTALLYLALTHYHCPGNEVVLCVLQLVQHAGIDLVGELRLTTQHNTIQCITIQTNTQTAKSQSSLVEASSCYMLTKHIRACSTLLNQRKSKCAIVHCVGKLIHSRNGLFWKHFYT